MYRFLIKVIIFCKAKLNFSCRCSFIIRKFKTQLEIAYYQGKSTENIGNVSDFRRIIFLGVV